MPKTGNSGQSLDGAISGHLDRPATRYIAPSSFHLASQSRLQSNTQAELATVSTKIKNVTSSSSDVRQVGRKDKDETRAVGISIKPAN